MLSERSYSRNAYRRERTSALTWLLCGLFAAFVLQLVLGSRWMHGEEALYRSIGVTIPGLAAGKIWTLVTHVILHRPGFIIHSLGNLLLLYFLGRELIPILGQTRFFGLFAGASAAGAMAWTAVHWRFGGGNMLIGATTAVYALATLYACFFPHRELRFLLFFVVPVNLKPRHAVLSLVSFDALGLLLYEIPGAPLPLNMVIAHSAHLGGMATAYLYYRYFHDRPQTVRRAARAGVASQGRNNPARALPALPEPANESATPAPIDIRVEVDRILDKINSDGFASLTVQERKLLDEAKHSLSRR
jgi:membrane associated rhomboid family serine protease